MSLLIILLGFTRYNYKEYPVDYYGQALSITEDSIYIKAAVDKVSIKEKSIQATVGLTSFSSDAENWIPSKQKVILYLKKETSNYKYNKGDLIHAHIKLQAIKSSTNPESFDIKKYLHFQEIDYRTFVASQDIQFITKIDQGFLTKYSDLLRDSFVEIINHYIVEENSRAICLALVLGQKGDLSKDLKSAFSDTGAMHVLAVSGLHIGILTQLLLFLFSFIRSKNKWIDISKNIIIISIIWFFALITGSSPAVIRAASMFSLFVIGMNFYKETNALNILGASALIMLLFNPYLIFMVSFQFSYLALFSIIYFYPKISTLYHPSNVFSAYIRDLIVLSLSAQVLVFPLGLYYFHQFPIYFIISSMIAVPAAAAILSTSLLLFAVESLLPVLNYYVANVLNTILSAFSKSIFFIQSLPYSTSSNWYLEDSQLILIYSCIICLMLWLSFKFTKSIHGLIICSMLLISSIWSTRRSIETQHKIIFYDHYKSSLIDIIDKKTCYQISDIHIEENKIKYTVANCRAKHQINKIQVINSQGNLKDSICTLHNGYLFYRGISMIILENKTPLPTSQSIDVDFLVINNVDDDKVIEALQHIKPRQTIIGNSMAYWKHNRTIDILRSHQIGNIHSITQKGSLTIKI